MNSTFVEELGLPEEFQKKPVYETYVTWNMNRKDHYSSREPLIENADIFSYRQSVSTKNYKENKKSTNTKTQGHTYKNSFQTFFHNFSCFHNLFFKIIFIILSL